MVLGGVAGGIVGAGAGILVGTVLSPSGHGALYGTAIGSSLGFAGGVHLANRSSGNLGLSALVTLGVGLGGYAAAIGTDQPVLLVLTPLAQLVGAIVIEATSAR